MNLQELKSIINEYNNKIIINSTQPGKIKYNKLLFQKYKNIFSNIPEMIYLINNYNDLEIIHPICYCGNKNVFINSTLGYHKYCSYKCRANNNEYQEKLKFSKLNNIDENGLNSYQRQILKANKTKLNNIDENGLNSYDRMKIKQKQTFLKRYGVDNYRKSHQFKDLFKNKEWLNKNIQKIYQSKKKNRTFNTSKDEEKCYNLLLTKFKKDDIERQYKSKLYPFNCDFYIKSLDLYIECNFGWTHNPNKKGKPFKNSVEDLIELEKLKNKNTKFYYNAINVWTKRDPLKLQTFKKNKLNYKIFYNIKQFKNWYKKI